MNFRLVPYILLTGLILFSCDKSTNPRVSSNENAVVSVTVGRDTSINIVSGQVQRVSFQVVANVTYLIQTSGSTDTRLELRDSTGKITLATDQSQSEVNGKITWTATGTGSVEITVSGENWTTAGPTTLKITATNWPDSYEMDNTLSAAKSLPADSGKQRRSFTAGDVDWVKVPTVAGQYIRVYAHPDEYQVVMELFNPDSTPMIPTFSATADMGVDPTLYSPYTSVMGFWATSTGFAYVRLCLRDATQKTFYSAWSWIDTTNIDKYEPDGNRALAKEIPTDGSTQTHILKAGEHDWVKFMGKRGNRYTVTPSSGVDMAVYNDSTTMKSYWSNQFDHAVSIVPDHDGMVFVDVFGKNTTNDVSYTISVIPSSSGVDQYEPDDDYTQANLISTDGMAQDHIGDTTKHGGDFDWLKFQADSGVSYLVQTAPPGAATISLNAIAGTKWGGPDFAVVVAAKTGPALFYVLSNAGPYKVWVSADKNQRDNLPDRATLITTDNVPQSHTALMGYHEWLKFNADSGKTYKVIVEGLTDNGKLIIYPDSISANSGINASTSGYIKASKSGMMFVDFSVNHGAGNYTIAVSQVIDTDPYEPDNYASQATPISVDGIPQRHFLAVGDYDWIRFQGDSGKTYTVTTKGLPEGMLGLFSDSTNAIRGTNAKGYGLVKRSITSRKSGPIFFDVFGQNVGTTGAYSVAVTIDTAFLSDDYESDNDQEQASIIALDSTQTHFTSPLDVDWIKFPKEPGYRYEVKLSIPYGINRIANNGQLQYQFFDIPDADGNSWQSVRIWNKGSGYSGLYYVSVQRSTLNRPGN